MIILIPAYEPGDELVPLLQAIWATDPDQRVVVVDDGSGPAYAEVFNRAAACGAEVIGHPVNMGKGYALRAGFAHIAAVHPGHDVVSADSDGQHRLADIRNVAARLAAARLAAADGPAGCPIVLGARRFTGDVPLRSRFGNSVTTFLFGRLTGLGVTDTQTGLRGYPASLLGWLHQIEGDRFEYELEVLLAADRAGIEVVEVPIETVYLDDNESSHFHPIRDSFRVYVPLARFAFSSLASFAIDGAAFFSLFAATGSLAGSVIGARLLSAAVNFSLNRRFVFSSGLDDSVGRMRAGARYVALAIALLVANLALMSTLVGLGVPLVAAKLATEFTLFLTSYSVQQRVVFRDRPERQLATPEESRCIETHRDISLTA
ncbi:MAG: GtrA family protein [Acidimicrobiales bacterium]